MSLKYTSRMCLAEQIGWEVMCEAQGDKGREDQGCPEMNVNNTYKGLGFLLCSKFLVLYSQELFAPSMVVCGEV